MELSLKNVTDKFRALEEKIINEVESWHVRESLKEFLFSIKNDIHALLNTTEADKLEEDAKDAVEEVIGGVLGRNTINLSDNAKIIGEDIVNLAKTEPAQNIALTFENVFIKKVVNITNLDQSVVEKVVDNFSNITALKNIASSEIQSSIFENVLSVNAASMVDALTGNSNITASDL